MARIAIAAALLFAITAVNTGKLTGGEDSTLAEIKEHVHQATAAAERRDFARAEEEWRRVLTLDSRSAQAYHNLGLIYYLEHKFPEAEVNLEKASQLDRSLGNARVLLGATLVHEGRWDRAIAELDSALKLPLSESAERIARLSLGEALFAKEDYAQALQVLRPFADKYPRDVDVLYNLGQAYLQLSAQTFRKIGEIAPDSYRVHQILADSLAKQGRYQDAIREYRLALEQKPDLAGVHYQIGALYRAFENSPAGEKAAIEEFQNELKTNPFDGWSEYRLGLIEWKRRNVEGAQAHFRRALELNQEIVPARLALARLLELQGDLAGSEEQLKMAQKLEPLNATAHYRLAQLYKRRGDVAGAESEMKRFEEAQLLNSGQQNHIAKILSTEVEPEPDSQEESVR